MKKFSRAIAMILVLVILSFSFTSCLSYVYRGAPTGQRILFVIVDIFTLPISLIALLIYIIINDASSDIDSHVFLANADNEGLSEYYYLMDKIYSLPEAEFAALQQILASLPETERIATMGKIDSLSETERFSLVNAYNSLPQAEVIASVERISGLSEAEINGLLEEFNTLSEADFDSMIMELQSLSGINHFAGLPQSRESMHTGLVFQH